MLYYHVKANCHDIVSPISKRSSCDEEYGTRLDEAVDFGWKVWHGSMLILGRFFYFLFSFSADLGLAFRT